MKQLLCLIGLLGGMLCPLCAQNWTPEDSLRLQRMLNREGEIKLNQEALQELEKNFLGTPKASTDKPWLEPDATLPMDMHGQVKQQKPVPGLRPYTGYTPYNWDPVRECKIDIDKPSVQDNLLRGIEVVSQGASPPTGMSFMEIFTKEFWNRNIRKRRKATLNALKIYGDSITMHYREIPRSE